MADCLLSESSLGYWLALVQLVHCLFMAFNEALLLFFPLSNSTVQSVLSETSDVPLVFVLPERVIFPVKSSKNYNLQLKNKIKYLSFCSSSIADPLIFHCFHSQCFSYWSLKF